MNLPTLESSNRLDSAGPTIRVDPDYLAQLPERSVKASVGNLPGWPSGLYELDQQTLIPPKNPAECIPPDTPVTVKVSDALSHEWQFRAEFHPAEQIVKSHPRLPSPPNEPQGLADRTAIRRCPEWGYERIAMEFKDLPKSKQESSGHLRSLVNTCLLKWADDVRQVSAVPSDQFRSERESHCIVYHHGTLSFESRGNLLVHWAGQIPSEIEPQLLIRGLKLYLDRDVEKAKVVATWAVSKFPESRELLKLLKLLSPTKVVTRNASGASRKEDFEWIRANQNLYRGQWVAIFKGKCLASGKDIHSVRETARKLVNLQHVLITFLPKEECRAPLPKER